MSTTAHLNLAEVKSRLEKYPAENTGITDELYSFGEVLIKDASDRLSQLDTKAFATAAYAGGMISVILTMLALWKGSLDTLSQIVIFFGIIGLMISAGLAIHSARALSVDWFSDNDWLRSECFESRDWLRRYRIATMWQIVKSHQVASQKKAAWIELAQNVMLFSFSLLALALFDVAIWHTALKWIWVWVR